MKKIWILFVLVLLLLLPSCGKRGSLKEGKCVGYVSFKKFPKVISVMDDSVQEHFAVTVTLKNPANGKLYEVVLNRKNEYEKKLRLKPGTYTVVSVTSKEAEDLGLEVAASSDEVVFDPDDEVELYVVFPNLETFSQQWIDSRPLGEIELADKFSRQIQINRKIISVTDILSEINCDDLSDTIKPGDEKIVTDEEKGVSVRLKNESSDELPLSSCKIKGIIVTKNTVIFPDNVTTDSLPSEVCHLKKGVYGEPSFFQGTALYGWGLNQTKAVYADGSNGDQIVICLSADGTLIQSIEYNLSNIK